MHIIRITTLQEEVTDDKRDSLNSLTGEKMMSVEG